MIKFIKVLHLFFVISWMGSLMVLTYLSGKEDSEEGYKELKRRLYIMLDFPSMIFALGLGMSLLFLVPLSMKAGWFHAKMTGTIGLVACDFLVAKRLFYRGKAKESKSFQKICIIFPLCLLFTLASIFLIRDKQKEWKDAYEKERLAAECFDKLNENTL